MAVTIRLSSKSFNGRGEDRRLKKVVHLSRNFGHQMACNCWPGFRLRRCSGRA
jgi:hypothetical protein